jgi:predicted transcriptional regulator
VVVAGAFRPAAFIRATGFESPELLFKVLSGKRWELLDVMTVAGAMFIREGARTRAQ